MESAAPPADRSPITRANSSALDVVGLAIALGVGLPSLLYPFGGDQAAFHYIGSGWLQGFWPYVEAFDHKPPGIFVVHALSSALFGSAEWAIRCFDLLAVLATGWLVPGLLRTQREARPGERGSATVLMASAYYGLFDYWDTAQVEIWVALLLVLSASLARRVEVPAWRPFAAGACLGLAFIFKYPAAIVGIVVATRYLVRSVDRRAGLQRLLAYGLGAAGATALCLSPIVLGGALPAWWEATVRFNLEYSKSVGAGAVAPASFASSAWYWMLALAGFGIAAFARRRNDEAGPPAHGAPIYAATLLLAAWLSVALQAKYWHYHHVVLLPFAVALLLWAISQCLSAHPGRVFTASCIVAALALCFASQWLPTASRPHGGYAAHLHTAWTRTAGALSSEEYLRSIQRHPQELEVRKLGARIAAVAEPEDRACGLGYEPLLYTTSGLRCPSRFFVTLVLHGEASGFRDGAWIAEFGDALRAAPPRFFLAREAAPLTALEVDYQPLASGPSWTVFQRGDLAPSR